MAQLFPATAKLQKEWCTTLQGYGQGEGHIAPHGTRRLMETPSNNLSSAPSNALIMPVDQLNSIYKNQKNTG